MDLNVLLPILFERSNATETFWNFYIVVALGILGFFSSAKPMANLRTVQILFTAGFLGFAFTNLDALLWVFAQRKALANEIMTLIPSGPLAPLKDNILPPGKTLVVVFHVACDITVLAMIWFLPRRLPPSR